MDFMVHLVRDHDCDYGRSCLKYTRRLSFDGRRKFLVNPSVISVSDGSLPVRLFPHANYLNYIEHTCAI